MKSRGKKPKKNLIKSNYQLILRESSTNLWQKRRGLNSQQTCSRSLGNTKTNYWSSKISNLNEESHRRYPGDGIPMVRSLLPKKDSSINAKPPQEVSLVNYLIEKSKQEAMVRKKHKRVHSGMSPEILFSKIEPEPEHIPHKAMHKNRSFTKKNKDLEPHKESHELSLNSRNKIFLGTQYDQIFKKYKSKKAKSFTKKKSLINHYKLNKKDKKVVDTRFPENDYCHDNNSLMHLWIKNTSKTTKKKRKSRPKDKPNFGSPQDGVSMVPAMHSSFFRSKVQKKTKISLKSINGVISQRRLIFNKSKRQSSSKKSLQVPQQQMSLNISEAKENLPKFQLEGNKKSSNHDILESSCSSMELFTVNDSTVNMEAATQRINNDPSPGRRKIFSRHETQSYEKSYF
ncbi:unnamed protein product [Moneuplotes crassus]|uniref:Uncharacterized protein n=1 Tax=Euplotes crassus TaxID=5936 RepID=A0AAD1X6Y7_EUPCR|nr:unnamed protein product [Moneuplotes crassus]